MLLCSATDVAIHLAAKSGTLEVVEAVGRFGPYWAIKDEHGTIEVALSEEEAQARVSSCS